MERSIAEALLLIACVGILNRTKLSNLSSSTISVVHSAASLKAIRRRSRFSEKEKALKRGKKLKPLVKAYDFT
jgi:hypothetical protein